MSNLSLKYIPPLRRALKPSVLYLARDASLVFKVREFPSGIIVHELETILNVTEWLELDALAGKWDILT